MKASKIRKGVLLVVAAGTLVLGCELVVDFDRTKIPVEGSDSATPTTEAGADASTDAPADTNQPDAVDAGEDAADDAAVDDAAADAPDGD
jgi:hypothetical protein